MFESEQEGSCCSAHNPMGVGCRVSRCSCVCVLYMDVRLSLYSCACCGFCVCHDWICVLLMTMDAAHVPADILQCAAVSREITFSSKELIDDFRLEQRVFFQGSQLEGLLVAPCYLRQYSVVTVLRVNRMEVQVRIRHSWIHQHMAAND